MKSKNVYANEEHQPRLVESHLTQGGTRTLGTLDPDEPTGGRGSKSR